MKEASSSIVVADGMEKETAQLRRAEMMRKTAASLAQALDLGIELVHVESFSKYGGPNFQLLFEQYRTNQMSALKSHAKSIAVPVKPRFVFGDPVAELLKIGSRKQRPELIAMATHGRKGLRRIILGSVTEDVIRNSRTPVMTVGPKMATGNGAAIVAGSCHIVVGTDLTRSSRRAEDYALRLAKRLNAKVTLVHCLIEGVHPVLQTAFQMPRRSPELVGLYRKLRSQALKGLNHRKKSFEKAGLTVATRLEEKDPAASGTILSAIKKSGADLAVIGTHGRNLLEGSFLGSSARRVILESPVPVITVR